MRRRASHRLLLLAGFLVTVPALAGEGPYLGIEGGGNFARDQGLHQGGADSGRLHFDSGYLGGIVVGGTSRIGLRPELELSYRNNDADRFTSSLGIGSPARGKLQAYGVLANLWYEARTRQGFFSVVHPYLGGGVGGERLDYRDIDFTGTPADDDGRTLFAYQGGAGVGFDLTNFLTLSLDYRVLQTQRGNFELDASGVPIRTRYRVDSAIAGLRFSFAGSEYRQPVPRSEPPSPPARPVEAVQDSDGDGVPNDLDKCAGTPPGFKVDIDGCIVQQTVVMQAVQFETASAQLTPSSKATLDGIVDALRGQPTLKVEIDGYTDSRGSAVNNLRLSERRARSVMSYLVEKGIDRKRLVAKGFGKARPIADNTTEEGRAQNRRVEFVVLNTPPTVKVIEKKPAKPASRRSRPGDS